MHRYLLVTLLLASVAAGATAAPSSIGRGSVAPTVVTKKCKKAYKHAIIARKHRCLRLGGVCKTRLDKQYHRYRFDCVAGRLQESHAKPPPRRRSADLSISMTDSADPATVGMYLQYNIQMGTRGRTTQSMSRWPTRSLSTSSCSGLAGKSP
jgi:hypothetical protein